jgi:peptidoglycan/xylan/chitin deacetylase (PgdA/CDA1 family)
MPALLQQLRSRLAGGFVLAFHDIEPSRLAELVDSIQPVEAVSLTELVNRSKAGKSTSGLFAITVDDGVGETVRSLSALFHARGWPGTFYICTSYVESARGMCFQWWRRIMPLLPQKTIELKSGLLDLSRPGAIFEIGRRMEAMWHSQRVETYLPLTLELADVVARERGISKDSIQPPPSITWREVSELSGNELISFESHGVSHAAMSTLAEDELVFEMRESRDLISRHTDRPCRHFAYPFGSDTSIGTRAAATAQLFYDSASTMTLGTVDAADPWLLPRIPLYPENPSWYANLKILLMCNRLNVRSAPEVKTFPAQTGAASPAGNPPSLAETTQVKA